MPLEAPSRSNNYLITALHKLTGTMLGSVTSDIAARLNDIEQSLDGFDSAAQQQVAAAIDAATDQLATLVTDQRAEFEAISAQVAAAADQLQAIEASGVAGSKVSLTPIPDLDASNVQAAIAELLAAILAEVQARQEAISTALAAVKSVKFVGLSEATGLETGQAYRLLAAGITHTLPETPSTGDSIAFVDGEVLGADAAVTIARNGNTIMGYEDDLELSVPGLSFMLWFSGSDWRIM